MLKVGVTGGIGSGKSTACRIFSVLGIPVFDADREGKRLLTEDPGVRNAVATAFGADMLVGGLPDRKRLASLVFRDQAALRQLNGIIHPAVRGAFQAWAANQHAPYVIQEAAILVETGAFRLMDHLVVVSAPEAERLRRVMLRDAVSEADVRARLRNQATDMEREAVADTVLVNDGVRLLIPQVLALHAKLTRLN